MKMTRRKVGLTVSLASSLFLATAVSAQSISIGLRGTGSVPTGTFAEDQTGTGNTALIEGAKNGFGYGLDVGIQLGAIGVYGGFDHIKFDCETTTCQSDGKYTMSGVTVGVKLALPLKSQFRPYVKGGVTFNDLEGGYGGSQSNTLTTERKPGYEIGAGFDYSFLGIISLTPQARYIGQNLKAKIPGVNTTNSTPSTGVNYFAFDLGFSVHTPFGGR
jgi:opacity protein-like surface antigen